MAPADGSRLKETRKVYFLGQTFLVQIPETALAPDRRIWERIGGEIQEPLVIDNRMC